MPCNKSYSKEHSFVPMGDGKMKCVHCGKTEKMKSVF